VYPIKVNQQRQVVEEVLEFGRQYQFGLEAGSKPELLAVAAMATNDTPIICNGFKDAEFIEMAMLAQKIGRRVIPVVEKYTELDLILEYAEKVGVRPTIGMRVKLAARGGGRWQSSGGYRSKFGLTVGEIIRGLEELQARGMEDCFQLLHFHLGSQIPNIRIVKGALNEAARVYVELVRMGAGLKYLDVGGGLGVDYDGSQTDFESSVNYTLQEYANDVVYHLQTICDEAKVPHPTIVSESGRATVAHHSLLVFNVLDVSGLGQGSAAKAVAKDVEQPLIDLMETHDGLTARNALESYHDAQQALDMAVPPARSALPRGESVLGDLPEASEAGAGDGRSAGRPPDARRIALGYLLLQLLVVPVDPRQLGHQAAVSDHADSSAEQPADAACGAG
jgi:arginine decarboxylase